MKADIHSVLITGATGFVGGHLARACLDQGYKVHCLIRADSKGGETGGSEGLVFHQYGGAMSEMQHIVEQSQPDIVFHIAALFTGSHRPEEISPLIESNITMGTHLVEAMTSAGVPRLVNAATSWQHMDDEYYKPVNLYAATKQAFETILDYYVDAADLKVVNLSLFDTYGPGDTRSKLIPLLLGAINEEITLKMSPGQQILDLVHVSDVAKAFLVAARQLMAGKIQGAETFCVSAERRYSLQEIVQLMGDLSPRPLPVHLGALPYGPRQVMKPWTKGIPLPDWKPEVSLESGLAELFSDQDSTKHPEG